MNKATQSYVVRLWRADCRGPLRATVIDVARPDELQHFADLDALFVFLQAQAEEAAAPPEAFDQRGS